MSTDTIKRRELKKLIHSAGNGNMDAIKQLIMPMITDEEQLLLYGVSAKFGLIKTYDFYFLTDRRVGDMEVTPFTGDIAVEIAYLHKIDAIVLKQPAFPLLMRLFIGFCYVFFPITLCGLTIYGLVESFRIDTVLSIISGIAMGILILWFFIKAAVPAIVRGFLKLNKSGIWLKLSGSVIGVLIFADRDKFDLIVSLSKRVSDMKRNLDKIMY